MGTQIDPDLEEIFRLIGEGEVSPLQGALAGMQETWKKGHASAILDYAAANGSWNGPNVVRCVLRELGSFLTQEQKTQAFAEGCKGNAVAETLRILFNNGATPSAHQEDVIQLARETGRSPQLVAAITEIVNEDNARREQQSLHLQPT